MRERQHDHPWFINRITLKDIEWIHGGDTDVIGLMCQCELHYFSGKFAGRCEIALRCDRNEFWTLIRRRERLR